MPETILNLLKNADTFVSGQQISAGLGITRASVWKRVISLRKKGYVIEAVPSKGYRLINAPDLAKEYLLSQVRGALWKELIVYDSVESTNDLAMSLAVKGGIAPGTVLIADQQTRGKGRLGRKWESPAGMNIYMSMLLQPDYLAPRDATMLTLLAAVSCVTALKKTGDLPVTIKWPNDLLMSDMKIGGILTEVRADPDRIGLAVVGIGINVNMNANDFSEEIKNIATSIRQETGARQERNGIIIRILGEFEHWYDRLKTDGKKPLLNAWRRFSSTLGRRVKATIGDTVVSGVAKDIDENGLLILKMPSGKLWKISSGDITPLR
jgi:BirA family biotin operon repressor/biotin-[acetyl-CoA-carboxylase] ligase